MYLGPWLMWLQINYFKLVRLGNGFAFVSNHIARKSVAMRHHMKLATRFYSPFQVVAKVGTVAYHLNLIPILKIHLVFHISSLKKKLGAQIQAFSSLPPINALGELQPEPKTILDHCLKRHGQHPIAEVLINSWESLWKL